jgi:hypothetical protein
MAGLGRKIFTAGDVLTASDTMNYLMDQTVMNFAGTAARSSAIATPTQGMVSYRDDIDNLELYNGSAWVAASGMQLIKKQTVGSAVASVAVTAAFSSTYNSYRIIYTGGNTSITTEIRLTLGAATTGYYYNLIYTNYNTTTPLAVSGSNAASFAYTGASVVGLGAQLDVNLYNPFALFPTALSGQYINLGAALAAGPLQGFLNDANSYTSFTLTPSSGTLTGGTIFVYGYGQ